MLKNLNKGRLDIKRIATEDGVLPPKSKKKWTEDGIFRLTGIKSKAASPSTDETYWYAESRQIVL